MDNGSRIIKMTVEYDGTNYAGWQRQLNSLTVQQVIEDSLEQFLGGPVRVTGSGRTDAGVHAMGQVISFKTDSKIPAEGLGRGLSSLLPPDVSVREAVDAAPDFDARRSARMRWYRFYLTNRRSRVAIGRDYVTPIPGRVDIERMVAAAEQLSGDHDFSAFRSAACTATRTRLTLQPIVISALEQEIIQVDFRCRSFLHNMVRILTGTIVAAGMGKLSFEDIARMQETGERHRHAVTVPPNGLFLWRVDY